MAITISGENNNDRILASDGIIDSLSGFNVVGVITSTSFTGNLTGDVTGNVTGNLTGNVNHTSNLLLQISGSEKFRVGGSGQLGIGGANYGTSGQVLTSGGSGSAATWSTIDLSAVTGATGDFSIADKIIHTGDTNTTIRFPADDTFRVETAGSTRLDIHSDGRFRVGCTAQPSGTVGGFQLDMGPYPGTLRLMSGSGASGTQSASVNIGGSNYNASLAHGSNSGASLSLFNYNTTDGNSTAVSFHNSSSLAIARILGHIQSHSSRVGNLVFMTSDGTHPVEKARLTHDGRFGIGDDNPDYMLQLKGTVPAIALEDTSGTHGFSVIEQNNDNLKIRCDAGNQSSGYDSNIRFEIDGTERLRIPSTGSIELQIDGRGIRYPNTQTPTNSNTNRVGISSEMRYYETGTFVPGLSSTVLNSLQNPVFTDASYARRIGRYVRVGHLVFCTVEIKMASSITFAGGAHTGIAPVSIVGVVPFKYAYSGRFAASGEPDYNPCNIWYNGTGLTDDTLYATLQRHFPGQAQIQITKPDTGGVDKYNSTNYGEVFPADSHVVVSYTYAIDSDNADY